MASLSVVMGLAVVLLIGGCTVGPDFVRPEAQVEQDWLEGEDPEIKSEPTDFGQWWTVFNDPVLDSLIETAYQQNLDLRIAGIRILESRAQLGIAAGSQYPQLQQASGKGRIVCEEIMMVNPAVQNIIREQKIQQLYTVMQTGQNLGMKTFEQSLKDLYTRGEITYQEALTHTMRPDELARMLKE